MSVTTQRMSSDERRQSILDAAFPVFAKNGFHGTTTRELAWEAGVSEATLYKHFKSKEDIYEALYLAHMADETGDPELKSILSSPPSTNGLCRGVQFLIYLIAGDGEQSIPLMMTRSLLEDGRFARLMVGGLESEGMAYFLACLDAAEQAGDLVIRLAHPELALWFSHHLTFGFRLFHDAPEVIDYPAGRAELIDQLLDFALRGLGLSQQAIERWRAEESQFLS